MLKGSVKRHHVSHDDVLFDAKIALRPEGIAFGAVAMAFIEMVIMCIHLGHLIFFYSVELLTAQPRGCPISDGKLQKFHRYFEAAISFATTFKTYTKDDSLFLYSPKHWLLPSIN